MNSGETFNWKRFRTYLGFELNAAFRQNFITTAVFALTPATIFVLTAATMAINGIHDWTIDSYMTDAVAAVTSVLYFLFFPIMRYGTATDKSEGGTRLMLPASHTEKFISMVFVAVILFPLIFAAIYLGLDWILHRLFPDRMEIVLAEEFAKDALTTTDRTFRLTFLTKFFLPFMVSSAGLCGALLFKRSKKVKTFITAAVSFIFLYLTVALIWSAAGCDADTYLEVMGRYAKPAWLGFQTFAGICCLIYVYFRTQKMQL